MTDIATMDMPISEHSLTSRLAFVFGFGEQDPASQDTDLDTAMLRSAGLTLGQIALARRVTAPVGETTAP